MIQNKNEIKKYRPILLFEKRKLSETKKRSLSNKLKQVQAQHFITKNK